MTFSNLVDEVARVFKQAESMFHVVLLTEQAVALQAILSEKSLSTSSEDSFAASFAPPMASI